MQMKYLSLHRPLNKLSDDINFILRFFIYLLCQQFEKNVTGLTFEVSFTKVQLFNTCHLHHPIQHRFRKNSIRQFPPWCLTFSITWTNVLSIDFFTFLKISLSKKTISYKNDVSNCSHMLLLSGGIKIIIVRSLVL